ncbi:unnamed protein product [Paramecium pentaurelia]|uniref:Alpha/beta hydrolase n=1 Tax=Paramecium pentaurelia TaxID=43138 RepID=A0A8S1U7B7_9CILI|nr:unnamed protein product [Paramecium pentaurelia]
MQKINFDNQKEEELIQIAKIIFPGSSDKYYPEFYKTIQYVQMEEANKIPFSLLEHKDKTTNNYIIYFHGNGENINDSKYLVAGFLKYIKANFILVEYPGYGIYKNTITSAEQIQKDALIVFDYIKQKFALNDNQIYVFGRSIGTGPAFYLGANRNFAGLIILSAYITLYKLVNDLIPQKAHLLLNENNLNNQENSQKIRCKCLFIHGNKDKLTFLEPIQELYNNLPAHIKENSYLSIQENMEHNSFDFQKNLVEPIQNFYPELKMINIVEDDNEYDQYE